MQSIYTQYTRKSGGEEREGEERERRERRGIVKEMNSSKECETKTLEA